MEFPHLGDHCSNSDCKRLDFLPLKCDACSALFCSDHITYATHSCKESYKKDNQVPVCPLCNKPIPLMPGEQADTKVGAHIDTDCQSDPARERRKVYTNRCTFKGCKVKELVPVRCDKCHHNFCLKHRHESDHKCKGYEEPGRGMSRAGAAALSRFGPGPSKPASSRNTGQGTSSAPRAAAGSTTAAPSVIPPGLSDDQALALAMQLSLQESSTAMTSAGGTSEQIGPEGNSNQAEDADEALARAIHQSQLEERRRQQQQRQQQQRQGRAQTVR